MRHTYTIQQVADLLGKSRQTVYAMIEDGRLPPPAQLGGVKRWRRATIEDVIRRESELITTMEAAELLGVARSTVVKMYQDGRLPPPVRRGKAPRWRRAQIEEILAAAEREATREDFEAAEALAWAEEEALAAAEREATREAVAPSLAASPSAVACPMCGHRANEDAISFEDAVEYQLEELAEDHGLYQLLGVSDSGQVLLRPVRVAPPRVLEPERGAPVHGPRKGDGS